MTRVYNFEHHFHVGPDFLGVLTVDLFESKQFRGRVSVSFGRIDIFSLEYNCLHSPNPLSSVSLIPEFQNILSKVYRLRAGDDWRDFGHNLSVDPSIAFDEAEYVH